MLAQVSDGKLSLGGLFNGLKVNPDSYKETISQFKKLDLSLPRFINNQTGTTNWDAIAQSIESCDETALSYFKTLDNGNGTINNQSASVKGFSDYLQQTGKSFDFAAVKATLLNTVLNAGIMFAISGGIQLAAMALDKFIYTAEEASKAMSDAMSEYESENSRLKGISSELDTQSQKLDDLLTKDKLTYAEKGQLKELQEITRELQLQQDIAERNAERASKEAADKAVDAYEKQYGNYDVSKEALDEKLSAEKENGLFPVSGGENDIVGNIASYIVATERLDEARANYENAVKNSENTLSFDDDIQWFSDMKSDYSDALNLSLNDLQEKFFALKDEYDRAIEKSQSETETLTSAEKDVIETYKSVYDTIRFIYEYMDQNAWNDMAISNILHTEGIEKTKDELIAMAESAELTPETIADYKKLNEAIQNSEFFLQDGQTAAEAFCEQINALIQTDWEPKPIQIDSQFSISDTLDQLNTRLKPALDSLGSAYRDIFSDDGFNPDAVDLPMLDSIRSSIEELNNLQDVDINIDMSAFDALASTLTAAGVTKQQAQQAFDDFATSVFYATGATENMTDETKALVEQILESLGVANAAEVAEYALAEAKAQNVLATHDLAMASAENASDKESEFLAILAEGEAAGLTRQQIYRLTAAELAYGQNGLSTAQKIEQLKNLAAAYGDTASAALATALANDLASGHTDADTAVSDLIAQINEGIGRAEIDFSGLNRSAAKAGSAAGRSYADALKDELSSLNSVISYIGNVIGNQIDLFNDQKDAAVDALEAEKQSAEEALEAEKALVQEKIDAKQAEIDKIQEAAKARKEEISLQKAQYNLERMQNQKTILQYSHDKGMHYVTDTKELRAAEEAYTEAKENIMISGMQKEISDLQDTIDSLDKKIEESNQYYDGLIEQTEKYWDSLIKGLEDYRSRWQELSGIEEQAKMGAALKSLGITTDDVLNMSGSAFESFKGHYLGILQEIYSKNDDVLEMLQRFGGISADTLKPLAGSISSITENIQSASAGISGGTKRSTEAPSLTDSIELLGETAEETLGEPDGEGATGRFGELSRTIADAGSHVAGVIGRLDDLNGMTAECTITVNIETTGGIPEIASGTGIDDAINSSIPKSSSYSPASGDNSPAKNSSDKGSSTTKTKGRARVTGDWGVREAGRTLVGELGRELWVHAKDGTFETVGDSGAEFIRTERGDLIFDHLRTEELLSKGRITGRGNIPADNKTYAHNAVPAAETLHADGNLSATGSFQKAGDDIIISPDGTVMIPYDPSNDPTPFGDAVRKWNAAMAKLDDRAREEFLRVNPINDRSRQMQEAINQISNTSISTQNIRPNINVGGINITCPGVTSQAVMREVKTALNREFNGLHNYADQWIRR